MHTNDTNSIRIISIRFGIASVQEVNPCSLKFSLCENLGGRMVSSPAATSEQASSYIGELRDKFGHYTEFRTIPRQRRSLESFSNGTE